MKERERERERASERAGERARPCRRVFVLMPQLISASSPLLFFHPSKIQNPHRLSSNSGASWSALGGSLASSQAYQSVATSSNNAYIFVSVFAGNLYVSSNSGTSFSIPTLVSGTYPRNWGAVAMSGNGGVMAATIVGGLIWVSTNSGGTFTRRGASLPSRSIAVSSDGSLILAAQNFGRVYLSRDLGVTWTAV